MRATFVTYCLMCKVMERPPAGHLLLMKLLKPIHNIATYCDEQMQCKERKRMEKHKNHSSI